MGPDLGHHDLDPLFRLQRPLVLAHELKVQPDVVDHAVNDGGDGEIGDGLVEVVGVEVQRQRADDQLEHQHRQPGLAARRRLKHAYRQHQPVDEQDRTDIKAHVAQGTVVKMVVIRDVEADVRKQRRQVDRGVQAQQRPHPPQALFRRDHPHEQGQRRRPDRIAVDRRQRPRRDMRLPDHQAVFQMILDHQAEHHRDDDPHDPLAVGADIVVDVHHDRQHAQQRQRGQQRQRRLIVADEEHAEIVMMKSKGPHREQNGRRDQQRDEHKSAAVRALLLLDPHRSVSFSFPYRQHDTGSDSDCQSAVRKTAGHIR